MSALSERRECWLKVVVHPSQKMWELSLEWLEYYAVCISKILNNCSRVERIVLELGESLRSRKNATERIRVELYFELALERSAALATGITVRSCSGRKYSGADGVPKIKCSTLLLKTIHPSSDESYYQKLTTATHVTQIFIINVYCD